MDSNYVTEFKLMRWSSPEDFVAQTQLNHDAGWRVETSRINGDGDSGWSVLMKGRSINPPYLETKLSLSEVYKILNSTEVRDASKNPPTDIYSNPPVVSEIDRQLKELYKVKFGSL